MIRCAMNERERVLVQIWRRRQWTGDMMLSYRGGGTQVNQTSTPALKNTSSFSMLQMAQEEIRSKKKGFMTDFVLNTKTFWYKCQMLFTPAFVKVCQWVVCSKEPKWKKSDSLDQTTAWQKPLCRRWFVVVAAQKTLNMLQWKNIHAKLQVQPNVN